MLSNSGMTCYLFTFSNGPKLKLLYEKLNSLVETECIGVKMNVLGVFEVENKLINV